jgi:hypothetical protein
VSLDPIETDAHPENLRTIDTESHVLDVDRTSGRSVPVDDLYAIKRVTSAPALSSR